MQRRRFLTFGFVMTPAFPATNEIRHNGTLAACVARQTVGSVSYATYTVTNAPAFLALTLPIGQLVLWGGTVLLPGLQYDATATGIVLRNLPLSAGDAITVISPLVVTG